MTVEGPKVWKVEIPVADQFLARRWREFMLAVEREVKRLRKERKPKSKSNVVEMAADLAEVKMQVLQGLLKRARQYGFPVTKKEIDAWKVGDDLLTSFENELKRTIENEVRRNAEQNDRRWRLSGIAEHIWWEVHHELYSAKGVFKSEAAKAALIEKLKRSLQEELKHDGIRMAEYEALSDHLAATTPEPPALEPSPEDGGEEEAEGDGIEPSDEALGCDGDPALAEEPEVGVRPKRSRRGRRPAAEDGAPLADGV